MEDNIMDTTNIFIADTYKKIKVDNSTKLVREGYKTLIYLKKEDAFMVLTSKEKIKLDKNTFTLDKLFIKSDSLIPYSSFGRRKEKSSIIRENIKNKIEELILNNQSFEKEITLEDTEENISSWMKCYKLAVVFYKYHGNLGIPQNFKTSNGIEADPHGINLGYWYKNQLQSLRGQTKWKLNDEQKKLLYEIGIKVDNEYLNNLWMKKYNLAKIYYSFYGNLEVPRKFRTNNGIDYDENGEKLGDWISFQRKRYQEKKIPLDEIELLTSIGMRFEIRKPRERWMEVYKLACSYYNYYGNLNVPRTFRTLNGIDKNEYGYSLGVWVDRQRESYKGNGNYTLTKEQRKLLEKTHLQPYLVDHETEWMKKYKLAVEYYNHHGNLEIPQNFMTTDGYTYDPFGICLGTWIATQKAYIKSRPNDEVYIKRYNLLKKIGFTLEFRNKNAKWNEKYDLLKKYIEHHNTTIVDKDYRTKNGINYSYDGIALGNWTTNLSQIFKGQINRVLTYKEIKALDDIGFEWYDEKYNKKFNKEIIRDKNKLRKQKELLNRLKSLLNEYDGEYLPSKEEINKEYIRKLNK